jgi:two-component sensor histidine kinase
MSGATSEAHPGREQRHRIANTLQFLAALARLRSQRIDDEEARRELMWMAGSIGSIGGLEPKRGPKGVDFAAYLAEMSPVWAGRHGAGEVTVVVQAQPLWVSDQSASTLCLIVQELVGNALAHGMAGGRAGTVAVELEVGDDGQCVLSVRDDGDGFDPEARPERFGLWLARKLAAQVRGSFSLTSRPGVTAQLTFPADC